MAVGKLVAEVNAAVLEGERSDLLDEFWWARQGQPVDERWKPGLLLVRELVAEPYCTVQMMVAVERALAQVLNEEIKGGEET